MKTRFQPLLIVLLVVVPLFLGGCNPNQGREIYYEETGNTNLANEGIRSISVYSNEKDLVEAFGSPDFVKTIEKPKSSFYIYGKNDSNYDVDFRLENGKITRYFIASSKYETTKGITIGSNKQDVMEVYGTNFYERRDTGTTILGYLDKENRINLEFGLHENNVHTIIVSTMNNSYKK